MKKLFLIIANLIVILLLTSCFNPKEIPIGTIATKEFSVDGHIVDGAIYQSNSSLEVSGKSEKGVVIVVTLLDYRGTIINNSYCSTDGFGEWKLVINTPKSSNKDYTIKITDSNKKYKKEYTDIHFGEVWLVSGDDIKYYQNQNEIIEYEINENNKFFIDGKWQTANPEISKFGMRLIKSITEDNIKIGKMPIGIVFATSDEASNIYSWLSKDTIDSRTSIKETLRKNGSYKDDISNLKKGEMSYFYEAKMKNIEKLTFSQIIWNQGIKDYLDMNKENSNFEIEYNKLIFALFSQFEKNYNCINSFLIIQESSNFYNGSEKLRKIQSNICNYFSKCKIVTTYDLDVVLKKDSGDIIEKNNINNYEREEMQIVGLNLDLICERIVLLSSNKVKVPSITNIVKVYNNEKDVISIKIIFNESIRFNEINSENSIGIEIYDINDNLIDLKYEFYNNEVIIDLSEDLIYDTITFEDMEQATVIHKISKISYAQYDFIYECNIVANGIPIIPFEFLIEN